MDIQSIIKEHTQGVNIESMAEEIAQLRAENAELVEYSIGLQNKLGQRPEKKPMTQEHRKAISKGIINARKKRERIAMGQPLRRRITDEMKKNMMIMYKSGVSVSDIAEHYGISLTSSRRYTLDIDRPRNKSKEQIGLYGVGVNGGARLCE